MKLQKVRGSICGANFVKALTVGFQGNPPIENSAFESTVQYVSDLFGWIHQSTATEGQILSSILHEEMNAKIIQKGLSSILDSLTRPLDIRLQQAIRTTAEQEDYNQIISICDFYFEKFTEVSGENNSIAQLAKTTKERCLAFLK